MPYSFRELREEHLTTEEAAKKIGISADSVKRYCNATPQRIRGKKIGHSWLIPRSEVTRYLRESEDLGRPKKAHSA